MEQGELEGPCVEDNRGEEGVDRFHVSAAAAARAWNEAGLSERRVGVGECEEV